MARLSPLILRNLVVTIGRVHITYADVSLDTCVGAGTEGLRFHTVDASWQQAFERDLKKPILKLVALDRASVYVLPQVSTSANLQPD